MVVTYFELCDFVEIGCDSGAHLLFDLGHVFFPARHSAAIERFVVGAQRCHFAPLTGALLV